MDRALTPDVAAAALRLTAARRSPAGPLLAKREKRPQGRAVRQGRRSQSGLIETFRSVVPNPYFGIVILQIGVVAIRPNITPFAQNGIPQVSFMSFTGISEDDRIADLAADL